MVRDLVADGQIAFGLTDTDDACGAIESGKNVTIIIPDQGEGEMGTLVIPNTVALIAGAPRPAEAKIFMDYLLDRKQESAMVPPAGSRSLSVIYPHPPASTAPG